MPLRYALSTLLLLAVPVAAQPAPGSCATGTASQRLDVNHVSAPLYTTGTLFYQDDGQYLVPKASGVSSLFNTSLWVGGYVDGALRMAGATYAQGSDFEFWPGPLNADGTLPDPNDCSA
jgi:hypothetical protein